MKVSAINAAEVVNGTETVTDNGIKTTAGKDAYQAIDLKSLKIYSDDTTADGTDDLEKATFTINGKKFAVVDKDYLTDDVKAELKAAGVTHFLDVESNDWGDLTADQLVDAAHKISMATGLTAENGTWSETNNVGSFVANDADDVGHIALSAGSSKTGSALRHLVSLGQHGLGGLNQDVVLHVAHHFLGHVGVADGGLGVLDVLGHHGQVVAGVLQTVLDSAQVAADTGDVVDGCWANPPQAETPSYTHSKGAGLAPGPCFLLSGQWGKPAGRWFSRSSWRSI